MEKEQGNISDLQRKKDKKQLNNFFLFVNSASGGGLGSQILKQEVEEVCFQLEQIKEPISVYFCNMKKNRERSLGTLKKVVSSGKRAAAIVCGGDGTVTWVVQEMVNNGISPDLVPLAIIPIGTGNDFSQELGWGVEQGKIIDSSYKHLKALIREWMRAKEEPFDLWEIEAEVYKQGKFQKVQNSKSIKLDTRIIRKQFCNYCSIGMDGKIGYSFDMNRTSTRIGNLAMYGLLGMLKAMTKTKQINDLVETMAVRADLSDEIPKQSKLLFHGLKKSGQGKQFSSQQDSSSKIVSTIFQSSKRFDNSQKELCRESKGDQNIMEQNAELKLQKDYCNLVAMNINSFMGGVKDIWANAAIPESRKQNQFTPPSTSDGKLEFISFASSVGMASQRVFKGQADKITQGSGPFHIQFKEFPEEKKHRTYLQVDGEFFRFTHPKSVLIRKSYLVSQGKIRILRKLVRSD